MAVLSLGTDTVESIIKRGFSWLVLSWVEFLSRDFHETWPTNQMQRIKGAVVLFLWNKEKGGKAHYRLLQWLRSLKTWTYQLQWWPGSLKMLWAVWLAYISIICHIKITTAKQNIGMQHAAAKFIQCVHLYLQLPEGVNVSKETRTAIGKAASVFILYLTAW